MRFNRLIVASSLLALSFSAVAADVCHLTGGSLNGNTYDGAVNCGKGTVESLVVNGEASLDRTTVSKTLNVNGALDVNHSTLPATTVAGALSANHSVFKGDLSFNGSEVTLSDTQAQNITINGGKLYIEGRSVVNGNITATGNAKIYISKKAKIKGTVTGASVQTLPTKVKLNSSKPQAQVQS
jgi:hypothetical protein